jgi:hypothetical protein
MDPSLMRCDDFTREAEANERHGIENLDSPLRHCYEQKYEHIAVYAAPNRAYGHVGSMRPTSPECEASKKKKCRDCFAM